MSSNVGIHLVESPSCVTTISKCGPATLTTLSGVLVVEAQFLMVASSLEEPMMFTWEEFVETQTALSWDQSTRETTQSSSRNLQLEDGEKTGRELTNALADVRLLLLKKNLNIKP